MPRRVRVNAFRHDRRTYASGQTAAIVSSQVLPVVGDLQRRNLEQLLGQPAEKQSQVVSRWTNQRITEFLRLVAVEIEGDEQVRRVRLEALWEVCVAVMQSRA